MSAMRNATSPPLSRILGQSFQIVYEKESECFILIVFNFIKTENFDSEV
jgi:hypothetical protein